MFKHEFPLLTFLQKGDVEELKKTVALSGTVGLIASAIIAILNESAIALAKGEPILLEFIIFVPLIIFFMIITNKATVRSVNYSQLLIHQFRIRVISEVFNSNLPTIDSVGKVNILQILGRDAQTVSLSLQVIVQFINSSTSIIFISFYIAYISFNSFLILFFSCLVVIYFSVKHVTKMDSEVYKSWKKESHTFELLNDFVYGFKEIKMNSSRGFDISQELVNQSRRSSSSMAKTYISLLSFFNYYTIFAYLILAVIVFVIPVMSSGLNESTTAIVTAALVMIGSVSTVINNVPTLLNANAAAKSLLALEDSLNVSAKDPQNNLNEPLGPFQSLLLKDVTYEYKKIDPIHNYFFGQFTYEFLRGKTYFIKGSNGSGKTTLMKLIAGLHEPTSGNVSLNGNHVIQPTSNGYRDLFSTVFTDFYLFKKLYGLYESSQDEIDQLINTLEMQDHFSLKDGIFSDLNLSTGQKKRVALIVALLEKRPILLLDEWAADQDPEFRHFFYTELLPEFKKQGKTVIAISHDDKYFYLADELIFLDKGKIGKQSNV
jgi:putative ATP-binding cassette transporter